MHWDKSDLLFLPVGGSEEIGMNANLYHYDDKWILIDFGISFPDETDLGIDVLLPDYGQPFELVGWRTLSLQLFCFLILSAARVVWSCFTLFQTP